MNKKPYFNPRWDGASIPKKHWHFHRQLLIRYRIVLGPGDFSEMLHDIRHGYAKLIERRTKTTSIYSVRIYRFDHRIYVLSDGRDVFTAWPPSKRLNDKRRALRADDD